MQKAVRETDFVFSTAQRLLDDRIREDGFEVGTASEIQTESNTGTIIIIQIRLSQTRRQTIKKLKWKWLVKANLK